MPLKPVVHLTIPETKPNLTKVEPNLNTKQPLTLVKSEVESPASTTKRDRKINAKKEDDQAKKPKTNVRRSNTAQVIAGNVNSGIGSPKNFATDLQVDDGKWQSSIKSAIYYSSELLNDEDGFERKRPSMTKINMELRRSFYSLNRNNNGDIQLPIRIQGDNSNGGYPDSRVAYRLASNEYLYKN